MYINIKICKIILLVINLLICIVDMYIVIKSSSGDVRLLGLYIMSVIGLLFTQRHSVTSRRLDSSAASL